MPESVPSLPEVRCGALVNYFNPCERAAPETKCRLIKSTSPIGITKTRGRRPKTASSSTAEPAPSRKPGSSKFYGVRFRPDLNKWVAEIRVAEWKAVDKKVWLGTFDTEEGAARGVDLARKLLKCRKKHGYNLPCPELEAYQGRIPANLILTDVTASHMFKTATVFIKRECQEYAAKFSEPSSGLPQLASTSHGYSFESEVVDELGGDSDHEESRLVDWPEPSISVDDYLNEDVYPSSCTSPAPIASFEHFLYEQQCLEMADMVGGVPFGDAVCVLPVPGGVQGPVSQECWDVVYGSWPGSSSALAPLPGSYWEGADMDMDMFPISHNYPCQHGSMRWN